MICSFCESFNCLVILKHIAITSSSGYNDSVYETNYLCGQAVINTDNGGENLLIILNDCCYGNMISRKTYLLRLFSWNHSIYWLPLTRGYNLCRLRNRRCYFMSSREIDNNNKEEALVLQILAKSGNR